MTDGVTLTGEKEPLFNWGQEVTVADLRQVVDPSNTLDFVEETRLQMVGRHLNRLLGQNLRPHEVRLEEDYIRILGAEAVLEHLPDREYNRN
jgi:hypothetical protein